MGKKHTCCFFGHRKIDMNDDLIHNLKKIIELLITNEKADTFLFGSRSQFNNLCLDIGTEYIKKYPHIKRIYVRAEFPTNLKAVQSLLLTTQEKKILKL